MEYCAAQAMLAEDLCQIVEGYVEYFKIWQWKKMLWVFSTLSEWKMKQEQFDNDNVHYNMLKKIFKILLSCKYNSKEILANKQMLS